MVLKKKNIFINLRNNINLKRNHLKVLEFIILNILIKIRLNLKLNLIEDKFRYSFNDNTDILKAYRKNRDYFIYISFSIESKSFRNSSNENDRVDIYGFLIKYKSSF